MIWYYFLQTLCFVRIFTSGEEEKSVSLRQYSHWELTIEIKQSIIELIITVEMSLANSREQRSTAGNRMSKLLDAEEEDEFYKTTYGGFNDVSITIYIMCIYD